ncbi:hypothetical protein PV326_012546 [Microctonus aethiopoides]|nr:hypothetical protein PV326_012546 [Microctonus aethiopoides]
MVFYETFRGVTNIFEGPCLRLYVCALPYQFTRDLRCALDSRGRELLMTAKKSRRSDKNGINKCGARKGRLGPNTIYFVCFILSLAELDPLSDNLQTE